MHPILILAKGKPLGRKAWLHPSLSLWVWKCKWCSFAQKSAFTIFVLQVLLANRSFIKKSNLQGVPKRRRGATIAATNLFAAKAAEEADLFLAPLGAKGIKHWTQKSWKIKWTGTEGHNTPLKMDQPSDHAILSTCQLCRGYTFKVGKARGDFWIISKMYGVREINWMLFLLASSSKVMFLQTQSQDKQSS